jgi:hypothetical protein
MHDDHAGVTRRHLGERLPQPIDLRPTDDADDRDVAQVPGEGLTQDAV